jgi:hypothetical protein
MLASYRDAHKAVRLAIAAVEAIEIDHCDYEVMGPWAYEAAVNSATKMLEDLESICLEMHNTFKDVAMAHAGRILAEKETDADGTDMPA